MSYSKTENMQRQEELYEFLLSRDDKWTSMEQCTDSCKLYPTFYKGTYHNSRTRLLLTNDIEYINSSWKYEKLIISGSRGVKLATKEEADAFLRSEYREVFEKLKRIRQLDKKARRDQQYDLEGEVRKAFLEE